MKKEDCIFCKIANGDIPSDTVYEDDIIKAFYDINPEAPVHFLIIPKIHIESADEINESNSYVIKHIFETIPKLADDLKLNNGYRILTNIGEDGGQSVKHLHFHVLGGKKLPIKLA